MIINKIFACLSLIIVGVLAFAARKEIGVAWSIVACALWSLIVYHSAIRPASWFVPLDEKLRRAKEKMEHLKKEGQRLEEYRRGLQPLRDEEKQLQRLHLYDSVQQKKMQARLEQLKESTNPVQSTPTRADGAAGRD